jgi:hypothetical protein
MSHGAAQAGYEFAGAYRLAGIPGRAVGVGISQAAFDALYYRLTQARRAAGLSPRAFMRMDRPSIRRFAQTHGFRAAEVAFGIATSRFLWSARRGARLNRRLRIGRTQTALTTIGHPHSPNLNQHRSRRPRLS